MKERLLEVWKQLMLWARRIELPFFDGLSLYGVGLFFFTGISQGRITNRASSTAYSFFLALFPGIIFLFTLIPYLQIEGLQEEIFNTFQRILPPDTYDSAKSTIDDIINKKRGGLLSFGFVFSLIFATNGINSLVTNFNYTVHDLEARKFWMQQLVSIMLTVLFSVMFLLGIILIIFSSSVLNSLLEFLNLHSVSPFLIESVRFLLLLSIIISGISILYNYGTSKTSEWRFISPGAVLATALIILSSVGFSYYVSHLSQYNRLYGSIGTLLVILLWIYINALVLIIGFELNASIEKAKITNKKKDLK